ncbi:probable serine/threonine-protein kinase DDB_G0279405 [Oppia nitens]|uniref:probable serine/threonine-protein kinase DDB_G0279405 n=1 Tax=Oppia nitens TaxID=1686743 RepID=UPI0023DB6C95|nr:probable serine/threonine-protein kinase DDB_G0279405 [Oppia nitens]
MICLKTIWQSLCPCMASSVNKKKDNQISDYNELKSREYKVPTDRFPTVDSVIESRKWLIKEFLGKGSYGDVRRTVNSKTGEVMACKKIAINNDEVISAKNCERNWHQLNGELVLLVRSKHHNHNNIVRVVDHFIIKQWKLFACYLVMELANGRTVYDRMWNQQSAKYMPLTEDIAKQYIRDTACGLSHLHENKITHKDIKLSNLLVFIDDNDNNNKCVVKIADFSTSRISFNDEDHIKDHRYQGTVDYMSPQIYRLYAYRQTGRQLLNHSLKSYDPFAADSWSLGVCLFVMICARIPFLPEDHDYYSQDLHNFDTYQTIYSNMINRKYKLSHKIRKTSRDMSDMLDQLLDPQPTKRLSMASVLKHKWLISDS